MKKLWESPRILVQEFEANEYVAACWKINCNVPNGFGFIDNNNNKRFDSNEDTLLTGTSYNRIRVVYGCGTWHTGIERDPNDVPVANAMWQPSHRDDGGLVSDGDAYDVYYWRTGTGQNDIHFSKVSDAQWETNPNAS